MTQQDKTDLNPELSGRLQALMLLRVIFVSLLLGASIFVQVRETQTHFDYIQTAHYLLIALIYFLTFLYVLLFKNPRNRYWLAYVQLLIDPFIVTAIIYATGGIESIFSFLYILTIINGSIILYRKGGFIIASSCSILYGLLLDLHYYGLITPLGSRSINVADYQNQPLFFIILVNIVAFYLVAYLSSYLSEQIRKSSVELEAKQIDLDKLEILNESIINSIGSGIIVLDERERIIVFNPAAEEIFGMAAGSALGINFGRVLPSFYRSAEPMGPKLLEELRELTPLEKLSYKRSDSKVIHLQTSLSTLRYPTGQMQGHILIFQDVTQIRQIQEEMKKVEDLALMGELAAGIAHEIRNPMAAISGSIQMLKDDMDSDLVRTRLMDIVTRETNRLNTLVNDFLNFARPKRTVIKSFDLNNLINESLELLKNSRYGSKDIRVVTEFQEPMEIESDPGQIKQILWNIFLNSSEAMPGNGTLFVETILDEDEAFPEKGIARIVVRDTGKGFDEKALANIFTPFFTTKERGSGLGLATVKRMVEGLKGRIYGMNHPQGGAQIVILLPVFM